MAKLTQEQFEELCAKADEVRPNAIYSSTDDTVKQCVATVFDSHWLFIYYRSIDDLLDDTWTCTVSHIKGMHVDTVTHETPVCSNVIPEYVIDKDGNKKRVIIQMEENEDD